MQGLAFVDELGIASVFHLPPPAPPPNSVGVMPCYPGMVPTPQPWVLPDWAPCATGANNFLCPQNTFLPPPMAAEGLLGPLPMAEFGGNQIEVWSCISASQPASLCLQAGHASLGMR